MTDDIGFVPRVIIVLLKLLILGKGINCYCFTCLVHKKEFYLELLDFLKLMLLVLTMVARMKLLYAYL